MSSLFTELTPKKVLAVAAHPDDLDVGAGGTLAHFASQGSEIYYLILTDGSKGSADQSISSAALTSTRRAEQQAALDAIGGKSVTFLDYPDGELEITQALKRDIVKAIRVVKPDLVVTMDPTVIYSTKLGMINHPDHRAAGQATLDAVYPLARDHLTYPDLHEAGYQPHNTKSVLLINFNEGNYTVDITKTFDAKLAAIKAHESQFDTSNDMPWVREMAEQQGKITNVSLGEQFVRIDIN